MRDFLGIQFPGRRESARCGKCFARIISLVPQGCRGALCTAQCCPYIYTLYLIRYINKVFYIYTLYLMPFPVILLELGWWQNVGPESLIDQILSCCLVLLRNKSVQISSVDSTVGKCVRYSMPKEVKCALTWEMSAGWRSPHVEKEKATTSKNGRKL